VWVVRVTRRRLSKVLGVIMVAVAVGSVRLCRAGRQRRSCVKAAMVGLFAVRMSVVERRRRRRQRPTLVIIRVMLTGVGGLRSVVWRISSFGGTVARVHQVLWGARGRTSRHGLRASKLGPGRRVSVGVRMHCWCIYVMSEAVVVVCHVRVRT